MVMTGPHPSASKSHTSAVHGRRSAAPALRRQLAFLREFVKAPHVVAAITPSSPRLAARMIAGLDLASFKTIVEFGPGTGTFTKAVLDALPPGWLAGGREAGDGGSAGRGSAGQASVGHASVGQGRFIAIEFNQALAEILRERYPQVTVAHDDAANVLKILQQHGAGGELGADGEPGDGRGSVDAIVSGLGWPSFSDAQRTRILEAAHASLREGGELRTFGYHVGLLMRGAWHFRSEVSRLFKEVHISRVVWRNAPPAFVYRCVK